MLGLALQEGSWLGMHVFGKGILWKGILLFRNCLLFSFMKGTFYCSGNDGLDFFCGNLRTSIVQRSAVEDTLPDKWRQLAGRQRKVLLEVSLWNDDSRMWKFGLVRVVMSIRITFIQVPLQVVDRQVSLITDTLQVDFQQISLNCCYGSFLSGKNLL